MQYVSAGRMCERGGGVDQMLRWSDDESKRLKWPTCVWGGGALSRWMMHSQNYADKHGGVIGIQKVIQWDVWLLEGILFLFNISIIKHHVIRAALKMSQAKQTKAVAGHCNLHGSGECSLKSSHWKKASCASRSFWKGFNFSPKGRFSPWFVSSVLGQWLLL